MFLSLSPHSGLLLLYRHIYQSWCHSTHLRHHRSRSREHSVYGGLCKCLTTHLLSQYKACFVFTGLLINLFLVLTPALPGWTGGTKDVAPDWTGWNGYLRPSHDHLPVFGGEWWLHVSCPMRQKYCILLAILLHLLILSVFLFLSRRPTSLLATWL